MYAYQLSLLTDDHNLDRPRKRDDNSLWMSNNLLAHGCNHMYLSYRSMMAGDSDSFGWSSIYSIPTNSEKSALILLDYENKGNSLNPKITSQVVNWEDSCVILAKNISICRLRALRTQNLNIHLIINNTWIHVHFAITPLILLLLIGHLVLSPLDSEVVATICWYTFWINGYRDDS